MPPNSIFERNLLLNQRASNYKFYKGKYAREYGKYTLHIWLTNNKLI